MSSDRDEPRELQVTRDSDTVRQWADEYGAVPVREAGAESDPARFRLVPESEVGADHEEVEWDTFFDRLEEGDEVVVYRGEDATRPVEVTSQNDVVTQVDDEEIEERLMQGETVTSTITETAVVERVVVEEATVESELVGTELLDQRVADVQLLRRECASCEFVEDVESDTREYFDVDRYLTTVGGGAQPTDQPASPQPPEGQPGDTAQPTPDQGGTEPATDPGQPSTAGGTEPTPRSDPEAGAAGRPPTEFPYHAELEVEEAWAVTREFVEQFVVESRIVDTDVSEADTLSDYDVDVEGLHRSIVEGGIVDVDHPPEEALTQYEIESELGETDMITTTFSRERTVEEEVLDRMLLTAEITGADLLGMETLDAERIESGTGGTGAGDAVPAEDATSTETTGPAETTDASTDDRRSEASGGRRNAPERGPGPGGEGQPEAKQDVETSSAESVDAQPGTSAGERVAISQETIGKDVVDATGEKIGIVSDIREERGTVYVDPHPGIASRIQAALGWGDADEEDYELETEAINRVTDDQVVLRSHEDLDGTERQH